MRAVADVDVVRAGPEVKVDRAGGRPGDVERVVLRVEQQVQRGEAAELHGGVRAQAEAGEDAIERAAAQDRADSAGARVEAGGVVEVKLGRARAVDDEVRQDAGEIAAAAGDRQAARVGRRRGRAGVDRGLGGGVAVDGGLRREARDDDVGRAGVAVDRVRARTGGEGD